MKNEIIPVFFTIDNNYAPYLDVAVRSMIDNASKKYSYKVIVLYQNLSEVSMEKIKSGIKKPFSIEFVKMKDGFANITDREENRLRCDYFTMTIYFRLFIAEMFPQYNKGIYIDSDVVIPGDISEMYNIDLKENIIGACRDDSVDGIEELARYMEQAIGIDKCEYINSGVLLMNLEKMRELQFSNHFLKLLHKYHFDCIAPDQDYINAMCNGKLLYMDGCWDTMPPQDENRRPQSKPKLIHFNLFKKPWCYDDIPYHEYFWKYASKSPFYQDIVNFKNNYSKEQIKSDMKCLTEIIKKAGEMDKKNVTFRKIRESGERIRL